MPTYNRTTTINPAPGGDSVKQAVLDLDTDLTGAFTHLNTLDTTKSATTHNHAGVYEPADATILKNAAIGVSVAAQGHNHDATYAPIAKGVTNGDSHDHSGGDGAQIAYSSLSGTPTSMVPPDGDKGDITVSASGATWTIDNTAVTNAKLNADVFSTDREWSGSQRGAVTTDNDASFDMTAGNNFKCTPTGSATLTFTTITAGQSGFIWFVNGSNYTISAHANTKINAADLAAISVSGTYILSYFSDGTDVAVSVSRSVA